MTQQTQHVFDESGVWITNTGLFDFIDWTNGCRFVSGVRTKAPVTEFTKRVPVLKVEEPPVEAKPVKQAASK